MIGKADDDVTSIPAGWDAYGPHWTSLVDERVTPAQHHARFCEAVGPKPQGPLECCPFRPWHDTQEPR